MSAIVTQLVNPIWHAATTRQSHLAYGQGLVRRFHPEVVPLAGLEDHSSQAIAAFARLVAPGERVWLFEEPPPLDPRQWRERRRIPGYQMICAALPPESKPAACSATARTSAMLDPIADARAMCDLKAVAFPGFFGIRTPQMGRYRGIRVEEDVQGEIRSMLIAMAGERLAVPGAREVSAICTHPAHLGHGYAQQLTREATAAILADGDLPFLHVAAANSAALHIYQQLGYTRTADALFVQLERIS